MKLVGLLVFFVTAWPASALDGYVEVPSQSARAQPDSGFTPFPGFGTIELVGEGTGVPTSASEQIHDAALQRRLASHEFKSLQVRDLGIETTGIYQEGEVLNFPYAVSIKHTQGSDSDLNGNQGTIDVAGEITVHFDGNQLHVTVTRFYDSWFLERWGRDVGFNESIDLHFARAVLKPVLEDWFNTSPERIQALVDMAGKTPGVKRP